MKGDREDRGNGSDGKIGNIRLVLIREKKTLKAPLFKYDSILDLLRREGIPVDGVLVFYGDDPVPLDGSPDNIKELRVLNVASGG